jgi:hypothetical protein
LVQLTQAVIHLVSTGINQLLKLSHLFFGNLI